MTDDFTKAKVMVAGMLEAESAGDLRAKSDALLERCGYMKTKNGSRVLWKAPKDDFFYEARLHPHKSIDDAVELAEAMGLRVQLIAECVPGVRGRTPTKYFAVLCRNQFRFSSRGTTIAAAICAAITEAVE